jgi:iron complex transport system ATP-binding protein
VLVDRLDMTLQRGEFIAVLGRNGTGKTLSLLTLAGLREADRGTISLGGEAIDALRRQQVAKHLALLPQDTDDIFPATVLDTALVGRHPHIGRFRWESPEDLPRSSPRRPTSTCSMSRRTTSTPSTRSTPCASSDTPPTVAPV